MKKMQIVSRVVLTFGIMLGLYAFTYKPSANTTLSVTVSGVKSADGNVHVLLFNNAVGYPSNPDKAYKHIQTRTAKGEVVLKIDNVPSGTYSIVSFHDKNNNGAFDKSWFGSPREDYGFSNIPREYCGTPSFQQTSFTVSEKSNDIKVKLINVE